MDYLEVWSIWTIWCIWSIRTQGLRNNHDPFDCENMSVRMCLCVRRAFSWSHVSFSLRFFSRSLLESAPCRGAQHSSLCSQLRSSLCSQLRSSQCRVLRSGVFVVQKKNAVKKCREISRNSGQIWLNFVENQLKFQQNFANFQKFAYFERFLKISSTFPDAQLALFINCVDLVKRFPTHIWLRKSDLIQRRTSLLKFEGGGF